MFTKFEQATTSSTRSGGLGLGLAIVHSLVGRHGGMIRAESEGLGHGATFTVRLPIHAARQNTDRRNDTSTVPALLRGVSIVVVDDHQDARESVAAILERAGATVLTAGSAREAIRLGITN